MKMTMRQVNTTANGMIKALETQLELNDHVARMWADGSNPLAANASYEKRREEIDYLINSHNKDVDRVHHLLIMLYITACENYDSDKLTAMEEKALALRMADIYVIEG